jgi:hypothetical protein
MGLRDFDLNVVLTEDMNNISHVEEESKEDDIIHPAVGMEFESSDNTFYFYNNYAEMFGFEAVRRTIHNKDRVCYRYT